MPVTLRAKEDDRYEMVSIHRRKAACILAGLSVNLEFANRTNTLKGLGITKAFIIAKVNIHYTPNT